MAWHDRDYNKDSYQGSYGPGGGMGRGGMGGGFGGGIAGRLAGASVVVWLLGINFGVFVLDSILTGGARTQAISPVEWGNFNVEQGIYGLQLWRLLTYQFFHHGFLHLLFNMIGLFFFGPMIERWFGSRRFLAFYLLCGVSGSLTLIPLSFIPSVSFVTPGTGLVGASGSIFGILAAAAVLFPHMRVMLLIPPIPMSMRTMALIFLGIAALSLIAGSPNSGGEAAHLGGALLGFILVKNARWLDWADVGASSLKQNWTQKSVERTAERKRQQELEVDRILDKVRDKGIASLTSREKKTLARATDDKRKSGR